MSKLAPTFGTTRPFITLSLRPLLFTQKGYSLDHRVGTASFGKRESMSRPGKGDIGPRAS